MNVYIRLQKRGKTVLLAICEPALLGRTLKSGQASFHVSEKFYKGPLVSAEEAIDLIKKSTVVNIVGSRIVKKAIKLGLVHPDAVLEIGSALHAQIVKM
ncbi:DUF424 family protein [Candidatus Bathyarchaeota archaeon]|nr:DUF424 family protein [Candidatus Bathyarchaeota archaeon]MCK5631289.1 DUF424 family protein [Candidatus Bathyarchaeota archaeon]